MVLLAGQHPSRAGIDEDPRPGGRCRWGLLGSGRERGGECTHPDGGKDGQVPEAPWHGTKGYADTPGGWWISEE